MKYKDIVYLVLDELKGYSDDYSFTEDHIIALANNYRSFLLKQKYSDVRKKVQESNYQEVCIDLERAKLSPSFCNDGIILRSIDKIPDLMPIGNPSVYTINFYNSQIAFVSRERMKYVGYNKYLRNIIYCSLGPDKHLYFKSNNPQHLMLKKVNIVGVFNDIISISKFRCDDSDASICDILDIDFPMESSLVVPLIELIVKELTSATYKPEDNNNNAKDDLANTLTKRK